MTDLAPAAGTAAAFPAGESARIRADFPILSRTVRDGRRAGLPRLRRHVAEAGAGARRRARLLRAAQRGGPPRRAPARRGGHRRVRGGAGHRRRLHRRPRQRGGVHQERHRGDQPGGLRASATRPRPGRWPGDPGVVRASGRATRSSSPRWSTTPTSCRGRSWPGAPAPRCAGRGDRRRPARPHRPGRRVVDERTKVLAFTHVSNVLGTVNPVGDARRRGPTRSAR